MLNKKFDVCIVGAGVAGALIAAQCARRNKKVILIEAGKKFDFEKRLDQLFHSQITGENVWPWENEDRDVYVDSSIQSLGYEYTVNKSRVKAVGGSTLHWGGMAQRLFESDFRSKTLYGLGVDWPISYADLERYYGMAENELGVSGNINKSDPPRSTPYPLPGFPLRHYEQSWLSVANKMGIELDYVSHARNSRPYRGRSQCLAFSVCNVCPSGAKYSADVHVAEAVKTGNCLLLTETVARKIDKDAEGNITAIHASKLSGDDVEIKADNYVIAAHAIETARLLLLSDIGNHSDQLGRNLMEHWYAAAGGYQSIKTAPYRIGFATLECSAYYDGNDRENRGAIKLEFDHNRDPIHYLRKNKIWGRNLAKHDCENFGHWISVVAEVEHQPNQNSRITLDKTQRDIFGDPAPHIHFEITDLDRKTNHRAQELIAGLLDARGIKDIEQTHNFSRAHHHMGTCRMSKDAEQGVVDKNCKVWGTKNLFVSGASVFPIGGARQPTLTIAALSLRLADQLSL